MTGILIISHHTLAVSLKETIAAVVGQRDNVAALCITKDERLEDFTLRLKDEAEKLKKSGGLLIFADMLGGTPCNASLALFGTDENVEIITGFNMPIVIEAVMKSELKPAELAALLMAKKEKTIVDVKSMMKKR